MNHTPFANRHACSWPLARVLTLALLASTALPGCSVCTEQMALSITNASNQPVKVQVLPIDDERLETVTTVLPPGGELTRDNFQVRCGMGPKLIASTLSKDPVSIETTFAHDREKVRIIGTPGGSGGLGIEFPGATTAPKEAAR